MSDFTELVDLAAERLGGAVLWATDDFFAEKENLLKPTEAIFIDGKYTDRGKWMDGWESRRKRQYAESTLAHPEHDYAIIRLGSSSTPRTSRATTRRRAPSKARASPVTRTSTSSPRPT